MKSDANPMQSAHASPRCTALSKRSGILCKNPAVRGWRVCRMHGAGGGQPAGKAHPNYKHGLRTKQLEDVRRLASILGGAARELGLGFQAQCASEKSPLISFPKKTAKTNC